MSPSATLGDRLPSDGGTLDSDAVFETYLTWAMDKGIELYPHQEEAVFELCAGNHVILRTPTGSGKSLVAVGMHYHALARGEVSIYTSPIKALVSEKFFSLCETFGAEHVGMMTGDASINREAPILCCTAEVLANMALREGASLPVQHVVMDEFHYYADRDRGMAWQIPLLTLPNTTFLLMSATLGDTTALERDLEQRTQRPVSLVRSDERPVPLDFSYEVSGLQDVVTSLLARNRAPLYIVNFSQREASDVAQSLTSVNVSDKAAKKAIQEELRGFRFDSPYGKTVRRFLLHGIGLHHAGLLPKYRLLVERMAQKGLLTVISGTDTLGVGVNVPIRTVLFTKLCKFDGLNTRILTVRDFLQIAGRAGRKGFDNQGWVVALAPEHVVENRRLEEKAAKSGKKRFTRKKPPERGYVHWDENIYERLHQGDPEVLDPVFQMDHGLVLSMLQRPDGRGGLQGWQALMELIDRCHVHSGKKEHLKREATVLLDSLHRAGVVERTQDGDRLLDLSVAVELQEDFSLHHTLSLFLLFILHRADRQAENYERDIVSYVESILENPRVLLMRQLDKIKGELIAELKAEGVPYEERMERLEELTWPKPNAERLYELLDIFQENHPWAQTENVRPKSIVGEMVERWCSMTDYINEYRLERSEGVLLRYVTQVYKALQQNVPEDMWTDDLEDILGYLRATLARTDSSLLTEWEKLVDDDHAPDVPDVPDAPKPIDILANKRRFLARVRAEVHQFVRCLSRSDWDQAVECIHSGSDWTSERLEIDLGPSLDDAGGLIFNHAARLSDKTRIHESSPRFFEVVQTLIVGSEETDPDEGDRLALDIFVDLTSSLESNDGPVIQLRGLINQ
jgi:superfamily II RNA helicase